MTTTDKTASDAGEWSDSGERCTGWELQALPSGSPSIRRQMRKPLLRVDFPLHCVGHAQDELWSPLKAKFN